MNRNRTSHHRHWVIAGLLALPFVLGNLYLYRQLRHLKWIEKTFAWDVQLATLTPLIQGLQSVVVDRPPATLGPRETLRLKWLRERDVSRPPQWQNFTPAEIGRIDLSHDYDVRDALMMTVVVAPKVDDPRMKLGDKMIGFFGGGRRIVDADWLYAPPGTGDAALKTEVIPKSGAFFQRRYSGPDPVVWTKLSPLPRTQYEYLKDGHIFLTIAAWADPPPKMNVELTLFYASGKTEVQTATVVAQPLVTSMKNK